MHGTRSGFITILAATMLTAVVPSAIGEIQRVAAGTSGLIKLRKIYFLVHPLTYAPECEHSYKDKEFYRAAREVENVVRRRYHEAFDTMRGDEALVIYRTIYPERSSPVPQELVDIEAMARRKLGRRAVVCMLPEDSYKLSVEFLKLVKEQGLTFDPQTVETEGWGESFDGCVAAYCAALSKELGLAKPMDQDFSMCVPDSVLLFKARFVEKATLGSKIRFYLFETEAGQPLAVFFDTYSELGDSLHWVDVPLSPAKVEVYDKAFDVGTRTPPPVTDIATPDGEGVRVVVSSILTRPIWRRGYLVGKTVDLAVFRSALKRAKLVE